MRFFNGKIRITKKRVSKAFWVFASVMIVLMTLAATLFPGGLAPKS